MGVAAAVATATLLAYFVLADGTDLPEATLQHNLSRADVSSLSVAAILGEARQALQRTVARIGAPLLLLASVGVVAHVRHSRWIGLVGCYVLASIAFNVVLFRLPGAGAKYLDSVVPAVALLVGASAAPIVAALRSRISTSLVLVPALGLQIATAPASAYTWPRLNRSRAAAAYIASNSEATQGVLATTVAVEFYSGRPVRVISFTYPRELVLRSLDGTSGEDIPFVVLDSADPPKRMDTIETEWNRLLAEHFEPVPLDVGTFTIYRRRSSVD